MKGNKVKQDERLMFGVNWRVSESQSKGQSNVGASKSATSTKPENLQKGGASDYRPYSRRADGGDGPFGSWEERQDRRTRCTR